MLSAFGRFGTGIFIPPITDSLSGVSQPGKHFSTRNRSVYPVSGWYIKDEPMRKIPKNRVADILKNNGKRFCTRR